MPDEKLEFSIQDLGRLGRHIGEFSGILEWLVIHANTDEERQRALRLFAEGFNEQ